MNILKTLTVIGFVLAAVFSVSYARAAECENGAFSEQRAAFEQIEGVTVNQLNADQIESMVTKIGYPPNAEGDFEAYLVVNPPLAAVFIVQKGCTVDRLGPSGESNINSILGIVKARGERVD